MILNNKTDTQILVELETWVSKEREAVSQVLHYLREVEERKLYLLEACSLKDFCMKVLKYSRHEAQARIDAMRLLETVPEIDADLDAGRLSLTVAAQTMSSFRKEDQRREASGIAALSDAERKIVLADLMSSSTREADRKLATHFPNQPQFEKTKPVSESVTCIEFNAGAASMKKFERLKAYYYHQTGGSWSKLFEILADQTIDKLDTPPRRAPGLKAHGGHRPVSTGTNQPRTRYVQKNVHQRVWANWERGCDHQLQSGERCGSRSNLQLDHIIEFSRGGGSGPENLRLLCGPHNRFRSDQFKKLRAEFMNRMETIRAECLAQLAASGFS